MLWIEIILSLQDLIKQFSLLSAIYSYDVTSENLILDQLKFPNWYFSLFSLLVCLILH